MTYNEFILSVWKKVDTYPIHLRLGQRVFNAVEELYGNVARKVQIEKDIDCFYNDDKIDEFIAATWELIDKK